MWLASAWRAMRLGLRGRFRDAESAAEAAFELGSSSGQPDAATWFAGQLFTLRWQQGRLHELVDMIEAEVASAAEGIPAWRTAYALALAEAGRLSEAEAILDEFLSTGLRDLPQDLLWLQGMAFLCSTCELVGRPDAAVVLHAALAPSHRLRSEARRVGNEWVSPCRTGCVPNN